MNRPHLVHLSELRRMTHCWQMTQTMKLSMETISDQEAYEEIRLLWIGLEDT